MYIITYNNVYILKIKAMTFSPNFMNIIKIEYTYYATRKTSVNFKN